MSSTKIELGYVKKTLIDLKHLEETCNFLPSLEDQENEYQPLSIEKLQQYQPIYSMFFDMNANNYNSIQLNSRKLIVNMNTILDIVTNTTSSKQIFIKYSPLFDPIKYMIGKYNGNISLENLILPTLQVSTSPNLPQDVSSLPNEFDLLQTSNNEGQSPELFVEQVSVDTVEVNSRKKMDSIYNASYVDGFFCYLSSKLLNDHGFKHAVDYYGSYLGIQKQYKMNIVDDYDYLLNSTFFNKNLNKLFKTTHNDFIHSYLNKNSRANRHKLNMDPTTISDDEPLDLNIEELGFPTEDMAIDNSALDDVYEQSEQKYEHKSDTSDSDNNYSSEEDTSSVSDKNDDDISEGNSQESEEENEPENIYAYIHDFPVQMIFLEKCDGTLDELFESGLDEKHAASALFQVIMTLIVYQRAFNFTHNDLHTNNIMYQNTEKMFLYYKIQGVLYKVPTHGKIFKIIDFGRSIYHFHGKRFCSDSFSPGGDAATQYNCEPYFNEKKPRIEPNNSFDLCRLGTSIFDFIFDIDDPNHDRKMTPLQTTILRWCSDDSGKNVLYKRNGEERYPNFKLYKMIARNVHKHTPEAQLEFPFFKQFRFMGKPSKPIKDIMNIDLIPKA